jgi:hypothetical protein
MPICSFRFIAAVIALSLGVIAPEPARAQSELSQRDETWQTPVWMGDVAFLSANALLGGLTGGILQAVRDGSFHEGFARGALGGALSYGGRRVAVGGFWGAGLLGRQVSAVGASVVRNASEARPALSRLSLPVGPVNLYVQRDDDVHLRAKVDIHGAAWLLSALLDERVALDGGASLSAGAPVFRTPRYRLGSAGDHLSGISVGGIIVLGYDADRHPDHDVFAHERVHVLQYDFLQEVWGDPLELWIGGKVPGGRAVLRLVRPGLVVPGIKSSLVSLLDLEWEDRPWEIEAEYLEHR